MEQAGVKIGDIIIMRTHMPRRKKVCLAVETGNKIVKYATFNNDDAAKEFIEILINALMRLENA